MNKLLSVCIPTYNMEALLARCLDSFIISEKNMALLEVIIVNDGSKDNSSKIAHEYAEKYPNTYVVIDKPNGNYGSCINAALKVANGKYFRICDADDKYDSQHLNAFVDFLNSIDSDLVFAPYQVLDFNSKVISEVKSATCYLEKSLQIEDVKWSEKDMLGYRAMHALCVKTKNLTQNKYKQTEGISYTDTEFVFYSVLYSQTCSFFEFPIYLYYLGRDGQTMSIPSMIKSHMHFYKNSQRMLDDYIILPNTIGKEKQGLLFRSLMACVKYFAATAVIHIRKNKEQKKLLDGLISKSRQSKIACPIEDSLMKERYYRLWKCYHVPSVVLYYYFKK